MSLFKPPPAAALNFKEFRLPGFSPPSEPTGPSPAPFVFEPLDLQDPGRISYSEAELYEKARQVLSEAEAQCQHMERQAYEQGFLQGQKDGQEVGERGLAQVIQRFGQLMSALTNEMEALFQRREEQLVELVLVVSRQVVGRELSLHPQAIRDLVEQGFQVLTDQEHLRLFLHPQDYEIVTQAPRDGWPPAVVLVADGSLTPGGFRLEASLGEVDGTLETRWEKVSQAVQEAIRTHDDRNPDH